MGASALAEGARRLGATQGPTRRTTMVVDPRAGGRLIGLLLAPASGSSFSQQRSFWASRLGTRVLAERLAPGGHLVINAPSAEGIFFRIAALLDRIGIAGPYARMWQKGFPSPHLSYFRPDHLARIATAAGLVERHRSRLPALRAEGLWERLSYDRTLPTPAAGAIYVAARAMIPFLGLLPPDIRLMIFEKPA